MSLQAYRIPYEAERFTDAVGTKEWVLTFSVPLANVESLRPSFAASVDNKLPGSDGTVYAPCIQAAVKVDDPKDANAQLLICTYKRPTAEMILRPGRALLSSDGYSTTVTEETAEFMDSRVINASHVPPGATVMGWTTWLELRQQLVIKDRGTIIVQQADDVEKELAIYARREAWMSKGGKFTVGGRAVSYPALPEGYADNRGLPTIDTLVFENLKLIKCQIERRATDLSVVDSVWTFAQKPEGWAKSGIVPKAWYCCSNEDGTLYTYDDKHDIVRDQHRMVVPLGGYLLRRLNTYDSEVIDGEADFTPIQEYFKWMT